MMNFHLRHLAKTPLWHGTTVLAGLGLASILAAGCASDSRNGRALKEELIAPAPPSFLVGPASALLVNTNSFSARVTLATPTATNKIYEVSGELLGMGARLLYAPKGGDRTFLWDVQAHRGYVLSEALQGYAPIGSPAQVTNLITTAETAGPARQVNGQAGHEAEVAVLSDDGSTAAFTVWCADKLDGFPARIQSQKTPAPFTLNLYDFRFETLTAKLFLPPEDFTKYSSPEAMTSELMMRNSKLRQKPPVEHKEGEVTMPTPGIHH